MISINSNLSSLIVRSNLAASTNGLNQAIERMTTGFKINHAKDNAANYGIVTDMSTEISSLEVAEDNASMALDLLSTADSTLELVNSHLQRIRDLAVAASNDTYSKESRDAVQAEIDARKAEIERIIDNTEYNDIKLFDSLNKMADEAAGISLYSDVAAESDTTFEQLGIFSGSINIYDSQGKQIESYSVSEGDTLGDFINVLKSNGFDAEIQDGVISLSSFAGNYIEGSLADSLGISKESTTVIQSTSSSSTLTLGNTVSTTADVSSTLADMGISNTSYIVMDSSNNAVKTVSVSSTDSINDLITSLGSNSITATMTNGVLSFTSASDYTITGELANIFGITQQVKSVEEVYTQTINLPYSSTQPTLSNTTGVNTVTTGQFMQSVNRIDTSTIRSFSTATEEEIRGATPITLKISTSEELEQFTSMDFYKWNDPDYSGRNCTIILANDIDMRGIDHDGGRNFSGTFDGNGYVISNLSGISGLFDELGGGYDRPTATIKNLGLVNVNFTVGATGALADYADHANIYNCFVTGNFNSSDYYRAAGLIGYCADSVNISNCYADVVITGLAKESSEYTRHVAIGGLVGEWCGSDGSLSDSYAKGSININTSFNVFESVMFGGIVGNIGLVDSYYDYVNVSISNVSSFMTINTNKDTDVVGGIVGGFCPGANASISNVYFGGTFSGTNAYNAGSIIGICDNNISISQINTTWTSNPIVACWESPNLTLDTKLYDIGITAGYLMLDYENRSGPMEFVPINNSMTIGELFNQLEGYGFEGRIVDRNNISFINNGIYTVYDGGNPSTQSNLCFIVSAKEHTQITIYSNTTSSSLSQNVTQTITTASTLGSLNGYSNGNGELVINKDGKAYATVTLSSTDTISELFSKLSGHGITGTLQNGQISFTAQGNVTLESVSGGSNLIGALHLGNETQAKEINYHNSDSNYLSYSNSSSGGNPGGGSQPGGGGNNPDGGNDRPSYNGGIIFNVIAGNPLDSIAIDLSFDFTLDLDVSTAESSRLGLNNIDNAITQISAKQTEIGAIQNRFESVLDEISTRYENLVSSRSTLRDADIAEVSSEYIRNQILQQASATLLATANQTPSIALQLL